MPINLSKIVIGLYVMVLALLPFSRLTELPILILSILGIYALSTAWNSLKNDNRFKILAIVFSCYLAMILISATDSYLQIKTLTVALSSFRFFFAATAMIYFINKKDFGLMFKLISFIIVFWAADALLQFFIGTDLIGRKSYDGRLNGIFGERHVKLGSILALLLPIVMIAFRKQNSLIRWVTVVLITVIVILSGTRSAWLMVAFTLIAYWFHHVKYRRIQLLIKSSIIASIIIVTLWFSSTDFQQRVNRSMAVFDGSKASIDFALADRLPIWKTSLNMIQQHPINGIGAHGFRIAYSKFAEEGDSWQQNGGGVGMHAHHWILEVLAETGIIGMFLFLFATFKLYQFLRSNYHKHYSWGFVIALISAFLPFTSLYSIFASFWSICLWFCGAGLIVTSQKDD